MINQPKKIGTLVGLFFLTFSLLALQVVFTRLYSYIFTHGYVYLIISMGMSGIGAGCFLYYRFSKILKKIFFMLIFTPILIMIALFASNFYSPNLIFSLFLTAVFFGNLGIIITHIYTISSTGKHIIYFIDLAGAATGSICSYFIMQSIGVPKTLQLLFIILTFSAWLIYSTATDSKKTSQIFSLILIIIISLNFFINIDSFIRLPETNFKEMSYFLKDGGKIIDSSWKAFGKVDLVSIEGEDRRVMFVDGGAGTSMIKQINPSTDEEKIEEIFTNAPALTLALSGLEFEDEDTALVIGSGAGVEVNSLLHFGFEKITAVEINPDFIEMTQKHGDFNGNLYNNHSKVKLVQTDGRQFVRNSDQKYKLMTISMPLIKSLRNFQNYSMAENYLFTSNAFNDYQKALSDNGYLIIIAHDRIEILRLFMNALKSFKDRNIEGKEAMGHIAIIEFTEHSPVMVIKKSPFIEAESEGLHQAFHSIPDQDTGVNFIPLIEQVSHKMMDEYNNIIEQYMFNNLFYWLSIGEIETEDILKASPLNIKPINDNSPFFYYFDNGIPKSVHNIFIMGVVLLLFIYFRDHTEREYAKKFIFIGIAFIMIEIEILQKFGLFWGQNTFALALLLAIILISTGFGSLFANQFKTIKLNLKKISILIPIVVITSLLLNQIILKNVETEPFVIKMIITIVFIFPQFFLMGTIFPSLLSKVKTNSIPKMIAINSIATMVGSVMAVMIAMTFGFIQIAVLGSLLYLPLTRKT